MSKFSVDSLPCVYMRGGTSKGVMFVRKDLPPREEWDAIFCRIMGNPNPSQMDGMGGCVSSNNKIVIVAPSERPGIDVNYLVGQSIIGRDVIDYKSNCGNMTSAAAPFAVEMGLIKNLTEPITTVHMYNENTKKFIDVDVPVKDGKFNNNGHCVIAGIDDDTCGELKVHFLNPAGSKTGKLLPTDHVKDVLDVPGLGPVEVTILDVSNPIVLVKAADVQGDITKLPADINADKVLTDKLEAIRGAAAVRMGFAKDLKDAYDNSPAVPKVGMIAAPTDYTTLQGKAVTTGEANINVRIMSIFQCHKACPLTSSSAISVAATLEGSLVTDVLGYTMESGKSFNIGHPSGIMTMYPDVVFTDDEIKVPGVAVARTARRIMDGTIYL